MARKFLYVIVFLIVLAFAAAFAYRFWGAQLLRQAMVPSADVVALAPPGSYANKDMWLARPDKPGNPALWVPEGFAPAADPKAAVFFVHPTSFLDRNAWNAPLDNQDANGRAELFLRGQASAFNSIGAIWAPRYRQATFGAFLTSASKAQQALDFAYRDVSAAFDQFLKEAGDRPIILAGHSQGGLHLSRLLVDRIAGTPLAKRIVAAYIVGWPVSVTADLPRMGLPACSAADQTGCILSWQSFGEPADPSLIVDTFDASNGFTGLPRAKTAMVCTNPITGKPGDSAPAEANLGALIQDRDLSNAHIEKGRVGARCDGRGFVLIGDNPPDLGPYVLPGNNYHVFDYSLFWANVRADAERAHGGVQAVITTAAADFRAALPAGRLLGLDVGTKTIGTALCDAGWSFASPALLIRRSKFTKDKAALADLIAQQHVKGLVIGLPLNLDGTDSPRTQSTRAFARNLGDMGLPILMWDERWSTVAVERTLIEQDFSRARRAEMVDNMAAAHILQAAIDALVNG